VPLAAFVGAIGRDRVVWRLARLAEETVLTVCSRGVVLTVFAGGSSLSSRVERSARAPSAARSSLVEADLGDQLGELAVAHASRSA